jgi:hypothetical protein
MASFQRAAGSKAANLIGKQLVVHREILSDGAVQLSGAGCRFVYRRLRPGVVLMHISGDDAGQFGTATQDEAATEFARCSQPLELFIDATGALGPATQVMEHWTSWFESHRRRLGRVRILVRPDAKVLQLTVAIAKHLSGTGDLIEILSDRPRFELSIAEVAPEFVAAKRGE